MNIFAKICLSLCWPSKQALKCKQAESRPGSFLVFLSSYIKIFARCSLSLVSCAEITCMLRIQFWCHFKFRHFLVQRDQINRACWLMEGSLWFVEKGSRNLLFKKAPVIHDPWLRLQTLKESFSCLWRGTTWKTSMKGLNANFRLFFSSSSEHLIA